MNDVSKGYRSRIESELLNSFWKQSTTKELPFFLYPRLRRGWKTPGATRSQREADDKDYVPERRLTDADLNIPNVGLISTRR